MFEVASLDEMERLERTVQRVFARVSYLESRVHELEQELAVARGAEIVGGAEMKRLQGVEGLARTA